MEISIEIKKIKEHQNKTINAVDNLSEQVSGFLEVMEGLNLFDSSDQQQEIDLDKEFPLEITKLGFNKMDYYEKNPEYKDLDLLPAEKMPAYVTCKFSIRNRTDKNIHSGYRVVLIDDEGFAVSYETETGGYPVLNIQPNETEIFECEVCLEPIMANKISDFFVERNYGYILK